VSGFPVSCLRREAVGGTFDQNNGPTGMFNDLSEDLPPNVLDRLLLKPPGLESPLPREFEKQEIDDPVEPSLELLHNPKVLHLPSNQLQQAPVTESNKEDSEETSSLVISNNRVSIASSTKALLSEE
jgi:hypothetical protein